MIRIAKLTDYGIVLLSHMARVPEPLQHNARDLAGATHIPLPTVSKVLKALARAGLVVSHRGAKGGYSLARSPEDTSVAEIIRAIEGPLAVTECSAHDPGLCELEPSCPVRSNWQAINGAVLRALQDLRLADMTRPPPLTLLHARTP